MRKTFDPLPFVFVPHLPVDEGLALTTIIEVKDLHAYMLGESRRISEAAHTKLVEQWPELLTMLMHQRTQETAYFLRLLAPPNNN